MNNGGSLVFLIFLIIIVVDGLSQPPSDQYSNFVDDYIYSPTERKQASSSKYDVSLNKFGINASKGSLSLHRQRGVHTVTRDGYHRRHYINADASDTQMNQLALEEQRERENRYFSYGNSSPENGKRQPVENKAMLDEVQEGLESSILESAPSKRDNAPWWKNHNTARSVHRTRKTTAYSGANHLNPFKSELSQDTLKRLRGGGEGGNNRTSGSEVEKYSIPQDYASFVSQINS